MTSYPVRLFELRCRAQRGTLYGVARVAVGRSSPPPFGVCSERL
ncbi:hypothetical protein [Porphyromonas gingivalis]|nr:hypothetical protein [Porphyromonas gingivalis]